MRRMHLNTGQMTVGGQSLTLDYDIGKMFIMTSIPIAGAARSAPGTA